ncbi:MAG: GGDEF domain-containing protein [Lachnospiraceae bacterium]|nr:GGDEF domain-containing protein [Lachnospiraceae bacterium]MCI7594849.1 GGDEF domain-containing protein [Lachnospiraceae bacterium]MDY3223288.1 GGDEF domain-containing protein [Lachnospiraceae bacterium]
MKEIFSVFLFNRNDYDKVKKDVWIENWRGLRFFSCIAIMTFGIMSVVSMVSSSIERNFFLYIGYGFISLLFFGVSHCNIISIRMKELFVYSFFIVLLSFGIVMGTIIFPEDLTVSYIVLMFAIPLLFTARAQIINGMLLLSIIIYIVLAYYTQDNLTFTYNLLDVIPYGILSMFVTAAIMRTKLQRILYQNEVESLEESERESQERISNYENFITDMVRYASSEENPDKVLNQLIQYIGERLNSERAYIFEENDHGAFDNTYEWCKEGISRELDNLQNVPYEGIIEIWYQQYKKSKNIVIYDLEEYRDNSEAIYNILVPQGVNTLVTGPIKIEGKIIGFYGVDNSPREMLNDISDLFGMMEFMISFMIRLRDNANALEHSALYDQLTDCKNRKALDWAYTEKYDKSKSLAVVMCDLNGLKEINDKLGHDAGDRFILSTAEILKSNFGNDHVYRIGGDEFIVVLPNITIMDFEKKLESARIQLGTSASTGVAYKKIMDTDFEAILKIADAEMYEEKRNFYISTGK